ncbi:guanine-1-methyltransferase-domain-containing protein [Kockovaella imperatae]|uniref:tRNA (guanine(9)-N1)-methyltransferase n=1 Tax=Kockovaella imperatae TaxID=4999 RepID=A0A1Y1U9G9_9TREE|nr:guanine-1-methyltransferase-domain-containing protein [Kockovaella imperatae]ORX34194.1 guanine-1-methyltransferase-domain-containing protein [Kockovaella imperatae]
MKWAVQTVKIGFPARITAPICSSSLARTLYTSRTNMQAEEDEEMNMNAVGSSSKSDSRDPGFMAYLPDEPGMSKNAMKRAAKQAFREAHRDEWKASVKAKKKEKKAALMEQLEAGTLDEEGLASLERQRESRRIKRKLLAGTGPDKEVWKGGLVVDLGFDNLMAEAEVKSLASQLSFLYATNRRAARPFSAILHTSFSETASPVLWSIMKERGWQSWDQCYWWHEGMADLAKTFGLSPKPKRKTPKSPSRSRSSSPRSPEVVSKAESSTATTGSSSHLDHEMGASLPTEQSEKPHSIEQTNGTPTVMQEDDTRTELPPSLSKDTHKLVYLSADASEELITLSEDEVYILGGLVDKNRYKLLCEDKAKSLGIRTARLPIGRYIADLPTRKVLTVNQTFEILVKYLELNNWAHAFAAVIPQRKFAAVSKKTLLRQRSKVASEPANLGDDASEVQLQEGEHDAA